MKNCFYFIFSLVSIRRTTFFLLRSVIKFINSYLSAFLWCKLHFHSCRTRVAWRSIPSINLLGIKDFLSWDWEPHLRSQGHLAPILPRMVHMVTWMKGKLYARPLPMGKSSHNWTLQRLLKRRPIAQTFLCFL